MFICHYLLRTVNSKENENFSNVYKKFRNVKHFKLKCGIIFNKFNKTLSTN